ncbi:hypothetical protein [Acinetobacter sp. ANC 3813]|uniref:hypothetical protein n=1 Tax=Acinetobacter sp. ANC 3813 TaxID=1977873 RepID=UPI000A33CAA8|nr:hypothetical protein [Acinetobacter sp. ANC 3813]OTG87843.1 hypothetical protein B9T34_16030 [Acinetobacter sp. ANC 3813]
MNFDLRAPCGNCPFRTDVKTNYDWLGKGRAEGIAQTLNENVFPCHKTTIHDDDGEYDAFNPKEQACYGAIVVLEHEGKLFQNQMMRIADRFGMYQHHQINLSLPIVRSRSQFIAVHSDGHYASAMLTIFSMDKAEKMALAATYQF